MLNHNLDGLIRGDEKKRRRIKNATEKALVFFL